MTLGKLLHLSGPQVPSVGFELGRQVEEDDSVVVGGTGPDVSHLQPAGRCYYPCSLQVSQQAQGLGVPCPSLEAVANQSFYSKSGT